MRSASRKRPWPGSQVAPQWSERSLNNHRQLPGEVTIIRFDEKDAPTPYNVDKYTVWLDVLVHPSLGSMISGASTQFNANFRQFAADTVFFIKQDAGPDHWLPSLPGLVTTIVRTS